MKETKTKLSEWKGYSFEYRNDVYEVNVRGLEIEQDERNISLYADEIKVTRNGQLITESDFGTIWSGRKMSEKDLLQQSLALYVNGAEEFLMHVSLDEFDDIYYKVYEKGTIEDVNEAYLSSNGEILHLQFATKKSFGYIGEDDNFAIINAITKEPITDVEYFFKEYVFTLINENVVFIYQSDLFKEWVKTMVIDNAE